MCTGLRAIRRRRCERCIASGGEPRLSPCSFISTSQDDAASRADWHVGSGGMSSRCHVSRQASVRGPPGLPAQTVTGHAQAEGHARRLMKANCTRQEVSSATAAAAAAAAAAATGQYAAH